MRCLARHARAVIHNAVIHPHNDQPLLADLFEVPGPADVSIVCTNLRTLAGRRPVFADHVESTFLFPLVHVRFLEIPPGARGELAPLDEVEPRATPPEPLVEHQFDENLLRRVREV